MVTIFDYRSSCIKCTKKVNCYENLIKKINDYKDILNLELPVYRKEHCPSEESICNQIEINDNFAKQYPNAFVIEYIEDINDIYLNSPIYEQEELENMENHIPTPLEFINTKELNTDGELLQDLFDEYNKLDPIANKNKFTKDITSAIVIRRISNNRKYYKK
jgi:hypothetical protein